jgi:hypothetical protein
MNFQREAATSIRGVERALFHPNGYQVFYAIAVDGKLVGQAMVCDEIDTPGDREQVIERLWRAIELYEQRTGIMGSTRPPLFIERRAR